MNLESDMIEFLNANRVDHESLFVDQFPGLSVPEIQIDPDPAFINKWISPFYGTCRNTKCFDQLRADYCAIQNEIDNNLITKLLTVSNWRSQIVGAWLAAIVNSRSHCEHIGRLLLRRPNSLAVETYVLALARFNSVDAIMFLRAAIHFHAQDDIHHRVVVYPLAALTCLDLNNQSQHASQYSDLINRFEHEKHVNFSKPVEWIQQQMDFIESLNPNHLQ